MSSGRGSLTNASGVFGPREGRHEPNPDRVFQHEYHIRDLFLSHPFWSAAMTIDRRKFLHLGVAGTVAGIAPYTAIAQMLGSPDQAVAPQAKADHSIRIANGLVELAADRIVSTRLYNGAFPGPLLRLKEGQPVVVDIHNDTDTPEQLHWHGQTVPADVDGAAEEGTPYIPAHGMRRISFTPGPAGLRFYHTHIVPGADLESGQYSGQVGTVYVEPKREAGRYDREVFLMLKEFQPTLSRGGDMASDFLANPARVKSLEDTGEGAMRASMASGKPHGYEVGYGLFSINGRMLGHGEPIRVKQGERVMFHIVNGSATEIRSLALPGHRFEVVALDGNPVPKPVEVPVLWLGTAERISAIVEMKNPGIWIMGDLADDDRGKGMGIVVEYSGRTGKPKWVKPSAYRWDYMIFGKQEAAAAPDETFEMTFAKDNAALDGFNEWTINGAAFSMDRMDPILRLKQGRRYRLRMRNASDDVHPVHLHRHSFELTRIAGKTTSGLMKDVVMLGGYQEVEVDFVADNPGKTLFHCHQQLHMDFGFMALFDYM
jgi:FtsP/CotA-like multicopper oxidase with cupredoxin domain